MNNLTITCHIDDKSLFSMLGAVAPGMDNAARMLFAVVTAMSHVGTTVDIEVSGNPLLVVELKRLLDFSIQYHYKGTGTIGYSKFSNIL